MVKILLRRPSLVLVKENENPNHKSRVKGQKSEWTRTQLYSADMDSNREQSRNESYIAKCAKWEQTEQILTVTPVQLSGPYPSCNKSKSDQFPQILHGGQFILGNGFKEMKELQGLTQRKDNSCLPLLKSNHSVEGVGLITRQAMLAKLRRGKYTCQGGYSKNPIFRTTNVRKDKEGHSVVYSKTIYSKINQFQINEAQRNMKSWYKGNHMHIVKIPTEDLGQIRRRVPMKQVFYELAAFLKRNMSKSMAVKVQTVLQSVPTYKYGSKICPSTEIILSQQNMKDSKTLKVPADGYLSSGEIKRFQGINRSAVPFYGPPENLTFPMELSLLDCILCSGKFLNMRAQFVNRLPDIMFLKDTLTTVNLSFNNFKKIPSALLRLTHLEVLKFRDNPIKTIPRSIKKLSGHLHTLVLSFCLIKHIPQELLMLKELKHLDISYNMIQKLPHNISQLRNLDELNVEGNKLTMLSSGLLKLDLIKFSARNNFLHPLFWADALRRFNEEYRYNTQVSVVPILGGGSEISPQLSTEKFCDTPPPSATTEDGDDSYEEEEDAEAELKIIVQCDHCNKLYEISEILLTVRICTDVFGISSVLVVFVACSETCNAEI